MAKFATIFAILLVLAPAFQGARLTRDEQSRVQMLNLEDDDVEIVPTAHVEDVRIPLVEVEDVRIPLIENVPSEHVEDVKIPLVEVEDVRIPLVEKVDDDVRIPLIENVSSEEEIQGTTEVNAPVSTPEAENEETTVEEEKETVKPVHLPAHIGSQASVGSDPCSACFSYMTELINTLNQRVIF